MEETPRRWTSRLLTAVAVAIVAVELAEELRYRLHRTSRAAAWWWEGVERRERLHEHEAELSALWRHH